MLAWLFENIATILICVVLLAIVAAIIINLIKNKRQGKSSCGNGCQSCPMSGTCHHKG